MVLNSEHSPVSLWPRFPVLPFASTFRHKLETRNSKLSLLQSAPMRCPQCQIELPDDATSCPSCATSLDDAATRKLETPKSPSTSQRTPSYDSIDNARFVPGFSIAGGSRASWRRSDHSLVRQQLCFDLKYPAINGDLRFLRFARRTKGVERKVVKGVILIEALSRGSIPARQ